MIAVAEDLAQALRNEGYSVFHDKSTLLLGEDYNKRIRTEIRNSDVMIVLMTQRALKAPSYVLAEIEIARDVWPSAAGRLLPVLLEGHLEIDELPPYVRSVHIYKAVGNPIAEILQQLSKTAEHKKGNRKWAGLGLVTAVLLGGVMLTAALLRFQSPASIQVEAVHFRPNTKPTPISSSDKLWQDSLVTIAAAPLTYNFAWLPGVSHQVTRERAELIIDSENVKFDWLYEVDLKPVCAEWLCRTRNAQPFTLDAKGPTTREVMFSPSPIDYDWKKFMNELLAPGTNRLEVQIDSSIVSNFGPFRWGHKYITICAVELAAYKVKMQQLGYSQSEIGRAHV